MGKVLKRSLLLFAALFLLSIITHAQSAFTANSKIVQLNIGGGRASGYGLNGFYSGYRSSPYLLANFEMALDKKIGPGLIGIGLQCSWRSTSYRFENNLTNGYYRERYVWRDFGAGVRVLYHITEGIPDKLDVYGGIVSGPFFSRSVYYETFDGSPSYSIERRKLNTAGWSFGPLLGGRYFFTDNFGVNAELIWAYRLPYFSAGLSIKL